MIDLSLSIHLLKILSTHIFRAAFIIFVRLSQVKKLKSRVLIFSCMDSIYNDESLQMNLRLDHSKSDFIEIFDTGTLVTEQLPQVSSEGWPRFTLAF